MFTRARVAVGAAALALVASGCAGGTSIGANPNEGADGTGEITGNIRVAWWGSGPRNEVTNKVIDLFKAAHAGTSVEGESADFDAYMERLNVQASSGNMPCVTQLQGRQLNDYTTKNVLLDLQPMIDSGAIDVTNIPAEVLDTGRGLDGKLYMIPYGAAYDAMTVNKTLADQAGVGLPPEGYDWAEFEDWLTRAKGALPADIAPVNLGGELANNFIAYVAGQGASLFEDRQLGFSEDLLVQYWDMWERMRAAGLTTTAEQRAEEPIQTEQRYVSQGRVMTDNIPGNALTPAQRTLEGAHPGQQLVSMPLPSGPAGSGNVFFPNGFSIATTCDNIPTAAGFINFWINDDQGAKEFSSANGAVTNTRHLQQQLHDPNLPALKRAELDLYQRLAEQNPESVLYPPGYHASFEGAFVRAYESVIFGGTSTRDAAAAFFAEVNSALASN
jgi:ABC-type glycerol-3-phosphate transport system substrate-binding protein